METPGKTFNDLVEYVEQEKERREQETKEFWKQAAKRRETMADFDKAVAMLSKQTGIDENTLHTELRKAMGYDGFPFEKPFGSFAVATALIYGYHPVVKLLDELRHNTKKETSK